MTADNPENDRPEEQPTQGPGPLLLAARERKGLSRQAVADALHLRVPIVQALEEDRYDQLPPRTFAKGYLKAYAKLVEVPEDEALAAFERSHPEPAPDAASAGAAPRFRPQPSVSRRRTRSNWLIWLFILLGLALFALWLLQQLEDEGAAEPVERTAPPAVESAPPLRPAPSAPEPTQEEEAAAAVADEPREVGPEPAPEPAAQPREPLAPPVDAAPAAEGPQRLRVSVAGESWVDVRDGDGRRLLSGVVTGERTRELLGSPPFSIVIGNAEAVRLEYQGEQVDLRPYRRGRVARLTLGDDRAQSE